MELTIGRVYTATEMVMTIINESRLLPQKGSYRLARMYTKLKPEYDLIVLRRNEMIEAYDYKKIAPSETERDDDGNPVMTPAANFSVPVDKMAEFSKAWSEVTLEKIDVDVQAIPLNQLDAGGVGMISALELVALGDLVIETADGGSVT